MRLLALLAALLWSGLAMAQPVKSLQFFDAPVFDQQLSDSLASRGQVRVQFPPGVPIASMPPRVSMWVAAVQNKGGSVQVAGSKDGKQEQFVQLLRPIAMSVISGFIGSAFPNVPDVLGFLREYRLFRNVDGYNAMLVFDKDSGHLVQMTLLPKE
ncbi:MAG: hypothetical protein ACO3DJ_20030 [Alphaproteobacteria bacterium]